MPSVSLRTNSHKFQEESSDLETLLLELGFLCENPDDVGTISASFSYNAHGSMASMPHLSAMDWDFAEKLRHITRGTTEAYYNYDGNGIRTRKVVVKNGVTETRLYLGGFEIWRKTVNGTLETERETLHVMDDQKRIAIVETLTVENGNRVAASAPVQRYQLDNHLGSASLELDGSANVISYEEYYPYGDTSYRAGRNASEVSQKRYRYTGKEKDEESSLYYCEQRYYAAHFSRWVSTDPTWLADGINLYAYVHGNPVSGVDPSGTQTVDDDLVNSAVNGDDRLYDSKGVFVKGSADVSLNERESAVNKTKKEIAEEDVKWSKAMTNETIDQNMDIEKESPFDFDDVGKKTFDCIQGTNYVPLKEMIKKIEFLAKEKIKSAPVDNPNENPYFDMTTNTIRYNPNQEMYGNYIDQFVHELTHALQKLEGRYKSNPIPISLEVEAFEMQFESMEYDGRLLMGSDVIKTNYSVFKANQKELRNYGIWLFERIYKSQNTIYGKNIEKYSNDYVK